MFGVMCCWLTVLTPVGAPAFVDVAAYAPEPRVAAAAYQVEDQQAAQALQTLAGAPGGAAALLRARAWRALGTAHVAAAQAALVEARQAVLLRPLVDLELGLLAFAAQDWPKTVEILQPVVALGELESTAAMAPLMAAMARAAPQRLLQQLPFFQRWAARGAADGEFASLLLAAQATALTALGQTAAAQQVQVQRFIETPTAAATPALPPPGSQLSAAQWLERLTRLVAAHRNAQALQELQNMPALPEALSQAANVSLAPAPWEALPCRQAFLHGTAARKLRRYAEAETQLTYVVAHCQAQEGLARQAAFLRAKVISIADGLRAIEPIERFVAQYPKHSMLDDVLFWAGDLYQRRGRDVEAAAYYQRITQLPDQADYCGEARWRLGWLAWRRGERATAQRHWEALLQTAGCVRERLELARVHYWLARLAEPSTTPPPDATNRAAWEPAATRYMQLIHTYPLSFYAQAALSRLLSWPDATGRWQGLAQSLQASFKNTPLSKTLLQPADGSLLPPPLCAAGLASSGAMQRALDYLKVGLLADSARQLRRLQVPGGAALYSSSDLQRCGPAQANLLLIVLLQQAGAEQAAFARLRRSFVEPTLQQHSEAAALLWRISYPLAFNAALRAGEQAQQLPPLFMQALSREESAFDPRVVSWAEAYGLTQLLLRSAQQAGAQLTPPVRVDSVAQLLEPQLNARLGAALLAGMLKRTGGHLALALVAYNAGEDKALALLKQYAGADLLSFVEEINIAETRHYVKRVLQSFGIYRWLYTALPPTLGTALQLPKYPPT